MIYILYDPKNNKIHYIGKERKRSDKYICIPAQGANKFSYIENGKVITPSKTKIKKIKQTNQKNKRKMKIKRNMKKYELLLKMNDTDIIKFIEYLRLMDTELNKKNFGDEIFDKLINKL